MLFIIGDGRAVGLVAQQPGLVLVMSGVDVDFDSHAYTNEIHFLRAERLYTPVSNEGQRSVNSS